MTGPSVSAAIPASIGDVLEALPVAVVVTDAAASIVMVNAEAESLFGYPRADLVGRSVDVLVPDAVRGSHAAFHHAYLRAPATRRMGANRDLDARRADGSLVPVEIALKPITGAGGLLVVATIVDITARKALESHVRDDNARLEELVRERTAELERSGREKTEMLRRLEEARADLERLSRHDTLTGLPNRREFAERADAEVRRSERHGRAMCFAMLDLDRFKGVNDRFGHASGDDVLRQAASLLREACRTTDVPARHGGEEFVLALPETDLEEARTVCERIRESFEHYPWESLQPGLRQTISIGVVERRRGEDMATAVARADALLYRAKAAGRNRVEYADVDPGVAPSAP